MFLGEKGDLMEEIMEGAWGFQGNTAKRSMNAACSQSHTPHSVNSEQTRSRDQAALSHKRWRLRETINNNK